MNCYCKDVSLGKGNSINPPLNPSAILLPMMLYNSFCMQLYAGTMADQQPTVVEEGADPLTAIQMSPPPIGQDVLNGCEQQGPEDSIDIGNIVMDTSLSAPHSVLNGESMTVSGQCM